MMGSYIEGKIATAFTSDVPQFTSFLSMEEADEALTLLQYSGIYFKSWGGFKDAERKMFGICSAETLFEYPIAILCGQWDKFSEIGHRDVLGSVMASGIERKCIGDILLDSSKREFYIFVLSHMAPYLMQNVVSVGRCRITWRQIEKPEDLPARKYAEERVSVSSLRIDCVISAVCHVSRNSAQELIQQKRVYINHAPVNKPTVLLQENDVIIVRGMRKFILSELLGLSRKEKQYIKIKQYL